MFLLKNKFQRILIFIIFYSILKFLLITIQAKYDQLTLLPCKDRFSNTFNRSISRYRQCLLNRLDRNNIWNTLTPTIYSCLDNKLWKKFDIRRLITNDNDVKSIILPAPNSRTCVKVTLGVGGDISAEEQLRALVPYCHFYGADPIWESGTIFNRIGIYFQFAVGMESGIQRAFVLKNKTYTWQDVVSVSLPEFLNKHVKVNRIDYFWIDNEGAEFEIFRRYLFENRDITICQIVVEMHGPLSNRTMQSIEFNRMMINIIFHLPYLPILAEPVGTFIRAFYVNTVDPYCIDKFFLPKFC